MSKNVLLATVTLAAALMVLALVPVGTVISEELRRVLVVNFPETQQIDGTVVVKGPIRTAELRSIPDIIVSPVPRSETTRLVNAGTLVTDGFPYAVLSLAGQMKGEPVRSGTVGVILLPEEEPVQRAFNEDGLLLFPLEIVASVSPGPKSHFASEAGRQNLAFPRYKVLLYNTTDRAASVTLFAYLTGG
jgi:hypothetical protein